MFVLFDRAKQVCGSRSIVELCGSGQVQQEGDTATLLLVILYRIHTHVHEPMNSLPVNLFYRFLALLVLSRVDGV
jgi:hypothetical protein